MTYAAMIFFVLAVVTGLYGFTSFEDGGEPGAAAMARLLAVAFAIACAGSGAALLIRRRTGAGEAVRPRPGPAFMETAGSSPGVGWSASERGSWDGARRDRTGRIRPEVRPEHRRRRS